MNEFLQEDQSHLFKMKFITKSNLSILNSIVMFIFFCFRGKVPFLGKLLTFFKLLDLIIFSFCFGVLVKTQESASGLQSFQLINNTG